MGNIQRRRNAKNDFERDLWKLMNNAVFGKTMEDVRRRKRIDLVRPIGEENRLRKMLADPALWLSGRSSITQKITFRPMDNQARQYTRAKNKKVIGKWKDENDGTRITRYADNHSKSYAIETENITKNIQKAKGLKKSLVNKELTIDIYERCILEGVEDKPQTANFLRCERFVPYIICQTKRSIHPLDSKRWLLIDQITTWAFGDCCIPIYIQALEKYGNDIPREILASLDL
ncbi:unnamed protein product [Rhizophagus irregularis]|nr:unnamed protein product [Rhizophagus irregularis]CAB5369926.1 unnamed protein product [Rhizophagus irregularis]